MAIPRTATEWDAETDVFRLIKCYRGREWFHRLRGYATACCHRVWELVPDAGREAVRTAERYIRQEAGLNEMLVAGQRARAAAIPATGYAGQLLPLAGHAGLAAWACTLLGDRPGLEVSSQLLTIAGNMPEVYAAIGGRIGPEVVHIAQEATDREMVKLVTLLRSVVGNPFRSCSSQEAEPVAAPDPAK